MKLASNAHHSRVQDPICGMDVDPATAARRAEEEGTTYYFCGARCLDAFRKDPHVALGNGFKVGYCSGSKSECRGTQSARSLGKYICPMCPGVESERPTACPRCGIALELAAPTSMQRQVQYICPKHPEVVQDKTGECPRCGMALELTTIEAEEKNPELVDMTPASGSVQSSPCRFSFWLWAVSFRCGTFS